MVFEVIAPKQMKEITLGRQRIQFIFQAQRTFSAVNKHEWLDRLKADTGIAKIAGIELTLLDSTRYFHKVAGINGAAQIAHDLGSRANAVKLTAAAEFYENSAVRRLGYLLDHFGHVQQAQALQRFAFQAKSTKLLNPAVRSVTPSMTTTQPLTDQRWKLILNETMEIDT